MLHPALRRLLKLQIRARLRKFSRSMRTLKGVLYLCITLGVFLLWAAPTIVMRIFARPSDPVSVRGFLAPGLMVYCLMALINTGPESGIFFFPAEVDLLFPAPFRRRELLLYRLTGLAFGLVLVALFFSVFLLHYCRYWVFGVCGFFLSMAFIQLVPIIMALVISIVGEKAYTQARKLILIPCGLLIALGVWQALPRVTGGAPELLQEFRATTIGICLLAPFEVFARTITAERLFPDFAGWGALAVLIDAAMVALILLLDANFMESSIVASQKIYQKIERARRGQGWLNLSRPTSSGWRLPMLPFWQGAGPIAWRQLVSALRGSRGILFWLLVIVAAGIVPAFFLDDVSSKAFIGVGMGILPMLSLFLLPQMLQFDFRGDVERIDVLKTLPTSALAVVAGELLTPVIFATLVELPLVLTMALLQALSLTVVLEIAILVPVFNLFLFAVDNLCFLWFPHRPAKGGAVDFQVFARQILTSFLKVFSLGIGAGLAAVAGWVAWYLAGKSWIAALLTVWCVVTALCLGLILLLALAFRSFDPSQDTPD